MTPNGPTLGTRHSHDLPSVFAIMPLEASPPIYCSGCASSLHEPFRHSGDPVKTMRSLRHGSPTSPLFDELARSARLRRKACKCSTKPCPRPRHASPAAHPQSHVHLPPCISPPPHSPAPSGFSTTASTIRATPRPVQHVRGKTYTSYERSIQGRQHSFSWSPPFQKFFPRGIINCSISSTQSSHCGAARVHITCSISARRHPLRRTTRHKLAQSSQLTAEPLQTQYFCCRHLRGALAHPASHLPTGGLRAKSRTSPRRRSTGQTATQHLPWYN